MENEIILGDKIRERKTGKVFTLQFDSFMGYQITKLNGKVEMYFMYYSTLTTLYEKIPC